MLDRPYKSNSIDITIDGRSIPAGLTLWHLDTDYMKTWLYNRIRWPETAEDGGFHLHSETDEDYCRQLVAEEVITKASGKRTWVDRRSKPNHYLDCEVNALGAAHSLHYEAMPPPATQSDRAPSAHHERQVSSHFQRREL